MKAPELCDDFLKMILSEPSNSPQTVVMPTNHKYQQFRNDEETNWNLKIVFNLNKLITETYHILFDLYLFPHFTCLSTSTLTIILNEYELCRKWI